METFDRVRDILCEQLDIESDEVTTEASNPNNCKTGCIPTSKITAKTIPTISDA